MSGLQQILLLFPGAIQPDGSSAVTVTPIISTGSLSGTIGYQELTMDRDPFQLEFKRRPSLEPLKLAVRIRSSQGSADSAATDSVSQLEATCRPRLASWRIRNNPASDAGHTGRRDSLQRSTWSTSAIST